MDIIKNSKNIEILTPTGFQKFDGIRTQKKPMLKFTFKNLDFNFVCTPDHLINFDDSLTEFKEAQEFKKGDYISHSEYGFIQIKSIRKIKENKVYDVLNVQNSNSIYITDGIKSHNCEFIGSNKTLITGESLKLLNESIEDPIDWKHNYKMKIYEQPQQGFEYILGVDPAEGLGKDSSVIQVLKITQPRPDIGEYYKLEQVAVFRDNTIKIKQFAQIVVGIGMYYNNAWAMVENNNACGGLCCHSLWVEYEYENMVNPEWVEKRRPGIQANRSTKYLANMKLSEFVETRQIKLIDKETIEEINNYEEIAPNVYAGGSGGHDDTVTALIWAMSFLDTKWYVNYGENFGSQISEEYILGNAEGVSPSFMNGAKISQNNKNNKQQYNNMLSDPFGLGSSLPRTKNKYVR
jgi:hypothetical protein